MNVRLGRFPEPATPTEADRRLAEESSRQLVRFVADKPKAPFKVRIEPEGEPEATVTIPASAMRLLTDILTAMARGDAIAWTPIQAELTTYQAADLLDVNHGAFLELLDKGEIPYHMVGTHRQVLFNDVMAFKKDLYQKRLKTLEELAALSQELGMGY
jgi:excisionase family DNA binding protein